jgi:DNA-binding MarR family transcriptional regulator
MEKTRINESTLVEMLATVVPRYTRAIREAVTDAEGPDRLTMPQVRCLQAIAGNPNGVGSTTSLAKQLRVTVPSMSSMVDGLVSRGLVERQTDPSNRRRVLLTTTPAGRSLLLRYQAVMEAKHLQIVAGMSETQQARLLRALSELDRRLEQVERLHETIAPTEE